MRIEKLQELIKSVEGIANKYNNSDNNGNDIGAKLEEYAGFAAEIITLENEGLKIVNEITEVINNFTKTVKAAKAKGEEESEKLKKNPKTTTILSYLGIGKWGDIVCDEDVKEKPKEETGTTYATVVATNQTKPANKAFTSVTKTVSGKAVPLTKSVEFKTGIISFRGVDLSYHVINHPGECVKFPGMICGYTKIFKKMKIISLVFSLNGVVYDGIYNRKVLGRNEAIIGVTRYRPEYDTRKVNPDNYFNPENGPRNLPPRMGIVDAEERNTVEPAIVLFNKEGNAHVTEDDREMLDDLLGAALFTKLIMSQSNKVYHA